MRPRKGVQVLAPANLRGLVKVFYGGEAADGEVEAHAATALMAATPHLSSAVS